MPESPFKYQQLHIRKFRIIRVGRAIVSLDTTYPSRPSATTMKAMQFSDNFPMKDFQSHYNLAWDALQDPAEQLHYPQITGESLRLEKFFQFLLEQLREVIVLGITLLVLQVNKFGTVTELFNFSIFQVPIKIL